MNTDGLIAEARRLENDYGDNYEVVTHMSVLADALEARQPSEDDRDLRELAEGMKAAKEKLYEIGTGIGGLAVDHPGLYEAYSKWDDLSDHDHADTVIGLLDRLASRAAVPDAQAERVSMEVLNEYRRIAAWLESQAALRGATGDTMHGLAAEALATLIDHEYSRHTIPLYGMLDVWTALYGTSHPEFDEFYDEHGYAEAWSRLMAEIRSRAAVPDAAPNGQVIIPIARIHELRAAKDAALAREAKVRELHQAREDGWCSACAETNDQTGEFQDFPCPTVAALDGAPEPEWEYACREIDEDEPWTNFYKSSKELKSSLGEIAERDGEEVVRRRKAGPWLPVEGEKP